MDSIYDRYGGKPFWEIFLNQFYIRNLQDPVISHFFEGKDINRIKIMNRGILLTALRTPEDHIPISLKRVHKNLGIREADFAHFILNFANLLLEMRVSEEDVDGIIKIINGFKDEIVTEN